MADEGAIERDDAAVDRLGRIAIIFIAVVMLIMPLWILAFVQDQSRRLAVITVLLLGLVMVLTWATLAKPYEILAATAGYVHIHDT